MVESVLAKHVVVGSNPITRLIQGGIMIEKIILVLGAVACIIVLTIQWVNGIDYMNTKHPDYKGEDFL